MNFPTMLTHDSSAAQPGIELHIRELIRGTTGNVQRLGRRALPALARALLCFILASSFGGSVLGQNGNVQRGPANLPLTAERGEMAAEDLQKLAADASANRAAASDAQNKSNTPKQLNFFQLLLDGGPLMIPLILVSILVLTISLERLINLRAGRILPRKLKRGLVEASEQRFPVEPQELYQLGLRYPSVASRILEAMLKKVGRPIPELETAVQDACQREADRLYSTVRWLTAAAAIAPLLGLLGTVWGMILAFFETTQPGLGINRTSQLAQGISIAFVNTLGGLSIAIPAAGFSHFFEGRIVKLINTVQELVQALIPRMERFEGHTRYDLELTGLVPRRRHDPVVPPPSITGGAGVSGSNQAPPADGDALGRSREAPRSAGNPLSRPSRNR